MRPDGFKNPYRKLIEKAMNLRPANFPYGQVGAKEKAFEAGADAYREALIHQPSNRGANVLYVDMDADGSTILHKPHRKGYLVFIPEEKKFTPRDTSE